MQCPKAQELLGAADPNRSGRFAVTPELEAMLEHLLHSARTAWPDVAMDSSRFLRHLARHLPEEPKQLSRLHATDLYLACACLDGDRRAIAHFDARYLGRVASHVERFDRSETFADEVRQVLREKLFVSASGTPKIGDFSGSGSLEGWVRVAAIRTAQNLLRRPRPNVALSDEEALALQDRAPNPELDYVRTRHAKEFGEIFREILTEQPAKDKNLLTLYFVDGLRSAEIGKLYGVHGATIRRWIERAREELLQKTRKRLEARLRLKPSEFESLMVLIQSQIDITISRFMAKGQGAVEPPR